MGRGGQVSWGAWGQWGVAQQGCPVQGPSEEAGGLSSSSRKQGHQGEARAAGNVGKTRSLGSVADSCKSRDRCRLFSSRYWAAIEGCGAGAGTRPEARRLAGGTSGSAGGLALLPLGLRSPPPPPLRSVLE